MEQRLIDANALLEELRKSCKWHAENSRELSLLQRDIRIVQEQPTIEMETNLELEYRKAKAPFFMTHRYIDAETKKEGTWVSTHCPVCFWNEKVCLWDSMIDRGTPFCSRCGQKIEWEKEHETD